MICTLVLYVHRNLVVPKANVFPNMEDCLSMFIILLYMIIIPIQSNIWEGQFLKLHSNDNGKNLFVCNIYTDLLLL